MLYFLKSGDGARSYDGWVLVGSRVRPLVVVPRSARGTQRHIRDPGAVGTGPHGIMRVVPDRDDSEREVMTSLPRTRPARRSAKRSDRSSGAGSEAAAAGAKAKPKPRAAAAAKPPAAAAAKPAPKPRAAKPKSAATKAKAKAKPAGAGATRRASARRSTGSKGSTPPSARPPRTTPRPRPATAEPRSAVAAEAEGLGGAATPDAATDPAPRVAPERQVPPAGYAAPSARPDEDPGGSPVADLVSTTVLAAAELAHIGLDVGRAALRSMVERLPKP